jgi:Tol biopolymer transport system component
VNFLRALVFRAFLLPALLALGLTSCGERMSQTDLELAPPSLSPDGQSLVLGLRRAEDHFIARYDRAGQQIKRLTAPGFACGEPLWSTRAEVVIFTRAEGRLRHLWQMRPDGTELRRLTGGAVRDRALVVSANGAWLYFVRQNWQGRLLLPGNELWKLSLDAASLAPVCVGNGTSSSADGQMRVLWSTTPGTISLAAGENPAIKRIADGFSANLSPDGTKLVYVTLTTNWQREVRLRDLRSGKVELVATTPADASPPAFSSRGTELLWQRSGPAANRTIVTIYSLSEHRAESLPIELAPVLGTK